MKHSAESQLHAMLHSAESQLRTMRELVKSFENHIH
jgi:ferritin-like metal-binding protein YciE